MADNTGRELISTGPQKLVTRHDIYLGYGWDYVEMQCHNITTVCEILLELKIFNLEIYSF
jgi:hypothetical protein